jgi:hypothetical protein
MDWLISCFSQTHRITSAEMRERERNLYSYIEDARRAAECHRQVGHPLAVMGFFVQDSNLSNT